MEFKKNITQKLLFLAIGLITLNQNRSVMSAEAENKEQIEANLLVEKSSETLSENDLVDYKLALIASYADRQGKNIDYVKAKRLAEDIINNHLLANKQSRIIAKYFLGAIFYFGGYGVDQNYSESINIFKQIEDHVPADIKAEINYMQGCIYYYGDKTIKQNFMLAQACFIKILSNNEANSTIRSLVNQKLKTYQDCIYF